MQMYIQIIISESGFSVVGSVPLENKERILSPVYFFPTCPVKMDGHSTKSRLDRSSQIVPVSYFKQLIYVAFASVRETIYVSFFHSIKREVCFLQYACNGDFFSPLKYFDLGIYLILKFHQFIHLARKKSFPVFQGTEVSLQQHLSH